MPPLPKLQRIYYGGGNLLYIAADRIRSVLVDAAGIAEANFAVIPIEGFWVNWQGVSAITLRLLCHRLVLRLTQRLSVVHLWFLAPTGYRGQE